MKPYAALFYGQGPLWNLGWGGALTSHGMTILRDKLRAMGFDADCYNFDDRSAYNACAHRDPLCLYGYSLGNTTALWLQSLLKVRLLFCIAISELAGSNNHPIVKANVAHSVLWHGPGIMSDVILKGFDETYFCNSSHLLMDLAAPVQASALAHAWAVVKDKHTTYSAAAAARS